MKHFYLISLLFILPMLSIIGCIEDKPTEPNKFLAYIYAEKFVKQNLKTPSTAKFPEVLEKSKHITKLNNKSFLINSWVDSQNSFGAMIRSEFSCTIIFEGNTVKTNNLKFNNK